MKPYCIAISVLSAAALSSCQDPRPPSRPQGPTEPLARGAPDARATVDARVPERRQDMPPDELVTRALTSQGVHSTAAFAESLDVDGDGRVDAVLHAGSPAGCVLAREIEGAWRVDALRPPFGEAPAQTICWPAIRRPQGAALAMTSTVLDAAGAFSTAALQLFAAEAGRDPEMVYQETLMFIGTWSFRGLGADGLELIATNGPTGLSPNTVLHKTLRRLSSGQWRAASCWGDRTVDPSAGERHCAVSIPVGTRLRRVETSNFGPLSMESDAGATALYAGLPAQRPNGPRSWCVQLPAGETQWAELPATVTARCTVDAGAPH